MKPKRWFKLKNRWQDFKYWFKRKTGLNLYCYNGTWQKTTRDGKALMIFGKRSSDASSKPWEFIGYDCVWQYLFRYR